MSAPKGTKPWNAGKGTGWTDRRGYRWQYISRHGKRVARREHRLVMERHLGRDLEPWELVHHRDGNTQNNALENLELMEFGKHTSNHHTGSRRDQDTRRSMEAFGLMRETLKKERAEKADLFAALRRLAVSSEAVCNLHHAGANVGAEFWSDLWQAANEARAAIAKAEGRAQ